MDINYLIGMFIIIALALLGYTQFEHLNNEVIYIKSNIDEKEYLVRNLEDKQEAANLLARIRQKLENLIKELHITNPDNEEYVRLKERFNPEQITEAGKNNKYTSYSINKGEKIVLCIRQRNDQEELIDENTITFVALHELAHIMTKSVGHTQEFWDNFKILLKEAIDRDIYKRVDYNKYPQEYCGITVSDTPL
jgi:predicted metal-dependent hydrolase